MSDKNEYSAQETKLRKMSAGIVEMLTNRGLLEDQTIKSEDFRKITMQRKRLMHHNTQQLLKHYRDIQWAIQCVPQEFAEELDAPLIDVDAILNLIELEMQSDHGRTENRLLSLRKSRMMLDRLHQAVDQLKSKPGNGELMYQIVYLTYMQSNSMNFQNICDKLKISQRQYYRLRGQAIQLLSILLWSAVDRGLDGWLDLLVLLEDGKNYL